MTSHGVRRKTESTGLDVNEERSFDVVKRRKTSLEIPSEAIAVRKTHIVKLRRATTISPKNKKGEAII